MPPTRYARQLAALREVAEKVARDGPYKEEPTKRRVRGFLNDKCVFDTLDARFVWEHAHYPNFYIPLSAIEAGHGEVSFEDDMDINTLLSLIHLGKLAVPGTRPPVDIALINQGPLKDFVKIPWDSLDKWLSEDEILPPSHPKDPYKRIECLPSSRTVRVEYNGYVIAQSSQNNIFLYETGLRTRYYIPISSMESLGWLKAPQDVTVTVCPYKGTAEYYDLEIDITGREAKEAGRIKHAVWYYDEPFEEVARIKGKICFYNEKFDIFVDGVRESA